MRPLEKFLCLDRRDRRLLVRSACVVMAMRIGLWILPVHRVRRIAAWAGSARRTSSGRLAAPRLAWAIDTAARYVPGTTCLPQALAADFLLARHGYSARFRIAVARVGPGRLTGHAWVESDGVVIGDADEYRDAPLQILGDDR